MGNPSQNYQCGFPTDYFLLKMKYGNEVSDGFGGWKCVCPVSHRIGDGMPNGFVLS